MSTVEHFLQFNPSELASLPAGEIDLGVPLYNDAIQINDFKTQERGRLLVTTEEGGLTTVRRNDGKLLQAEIVEEDIRNNVTITTRRLPVLREPVDAIQFIPEVYRGRTFWYASGREQPLRVLEPARFETLTLTIGSYALLKLRKLQHSATSS